MMMLHVLGSGSSGNCYLLENDNAALLLECGVSPKNLFKDYSSVASRITGILLTHEHGDHAGYVRDFLHYGIELYASQGTIDALRLEHAGFAHALLPLGRSSIGKFTVCAFPVTHDAAAPFGYLISHDDMGKLLFITDTGDVRYDFRPFQVNHLLVEANYADDELETGVIDGTVLPQLALRIKQNHLSIDDCCTVIGENNSPDLQTVILCHLSANNATPQYFIRRAQEAAPFSKIFAAHAGMTINLNSSPFDCFKLL